MKKFRNYLQLISMLRKHTRHLVSVSICVLQLQVTTKYHVVCRLGASRVALSCVRLPLSICGKLSDDRTACWHHFCTYSEICKDALHSHFLLFNYETPPSSQLLLLLLPISSAGEVSTVAHPHLTLYHQSQWLSAWLNTVPFGQRNESRLPSFWQKWNTWNTSRPNK
jgi:hypothetical protein